MASAYHTASESAATLIAVVILVALLAKEGKTFYKREWENVAREEWQHTLNESQFTQGENESRSRWAAQLIGDLKHGEIEYFLIRLTVARAQHSVRVCINLTNKKKIFFFGNPWNMIVEKSVTIYIFETINYYTALFSPLISPLL